MTAPSLTERVLARTAEITDRKAGMVFAIYAVIAAGLLASGCLVVQLVEGALG